MVGLFKDPTNDLIWVITLLSITGVILRPFRWPEAIWAVSGAALLVVTGLLSPMTALTAISRGFDVYLFLAGMMLLSELARKNGLFVWLAAYTTRCAAGSASRLFTLIYIVGVVVTIFLSNDATAIVLTPAVAAAARRAKVTSPLPYLLICAFVANAASFVLPISNPANLVIYSAHMPPLFDWLMHFGLASAVAIITTYIILRWTQASDLHQSITTNIQIPQWSTGTRIAACGIIGAGLVLVGCSALGLQLGLPTFIVSVIATSSTLVVERQSPWQTLRDIAWGVLPLVAGLFVLVAALNQTGAISWLAARMNQLAAYPTGGPLALGTMLALICNVMNNLPAGLLAGRAAQIGTLPDALHGAILIGTDLGPNLSITGSLATILWLHALRREGLTVSAWAFIKVGIRATPPALLLALGITTLFR